jgi:dipeptidyl aminopeptidase/acylaminoacyl peptidase
MRSWLLVILLAGPALSQAKHPFTFEDMMALKRVEEPVPSPDGEWVVFAAVDVDLKANTKTPHVWVVPLSPSTADPHSTPTSAESVAQGRLSTASENSRANSSVSLGLTSAEKVGMTEGREREIIADQDADRPRWAPDGKRFAFVSTKENGSQIWIADFDGATETVTGKRRLTNIATEADGELWSPDGKNILFKSDVYPECDGVPHAEYDCNETKLEEKKNSKIKALVFTHLLYRHWNAYKEGKRTHLFVVPVDGCAHAHVGPGALTRVGEQGSPAATQSAAGRVGAPAPTRDEEDSSFCSAASRPHSRRLRCAGVFAGGQDDYAFSADGQEICYTSNHDAVPAASTNNVLFTVPVNFLADATSKDVLAATKSITAENKAADNTPLYSPDGKYIAYRAQQRPGYESDRWRLMLYARRTGEKKNPTSDFEGWVGSFTWKPDSSVLYFSSEEKGESSIFELRLCIREMTAAPCGVWHAGTAPFDPVITELVRGFNDVLAFSSDVPESLLYTRMSIQTPNEIYRTVVQESRATANDCEKQKSGTRRDLVSVGLMRCL